jgi:hypothetical protein
VPDHVAPAAIAPEIDRQQQGDAGAAAMPANPEISTLTPSSALSSANRLQELGFKDAGIKEPTDSRLSATALKNEITVLGIRSIA